MLLTDAPLIFKLWGIPFVLVGLYMMVGRFFVDAIQRSKTYYGVTNERVIIVSGLLNRKIRSINLRTLTDISLDEKSDGSGTITFGAMNPASWWSTDMSFQVRGQPFLPSFELIPEAKKVYEIIREVQRQLV